MEPIDVAAFVRVNDPKEALWDQLRAPKSPGARWMQRLTQDSLRDGGISLRCSYCRGGAPPCPHMQVVIQASQWLRRERDTPSPAWEGVSHINAYSKAQTWIGRLLSNFAHTPFRLDEDGEFASIEGYWYWLSCPSDKRDILRSLYGAEAKRQGRALRGRDWPQRPGFERLISIAILEKVRSNAGVREALQESGELPILHYYVHDGHLSHVTDGGWMWKLYEEIRSKGVESATVPDTVAGSQVSLF